MAPADERVVLPESYVQPLPTARLRDCVVATLFSLVALFFTYDSLTGEKADGTLKLVFSTAASRAQILAGKWAGTFLTLAVPFLLATLCGMLVLGFI